MANLSDFFRRLTRGMAVETLADHSDRQLVERALAGADEIAFQAIVCRHGPMVYRVCWRVLQHAQDTEDAFQATFLVLAQKLRTLRKHASLASWLHGVAHRVALRAKGRAAAQCRRDRQASHPEFVLRDELTWGELRSALDFELSQLPDKWRLPLILCYLEDRGQDESAQHLGWSKRTLRRRLEEARAALGARLRGRGITLPAALSATLVSDCLASPAPAAELVASTVEAAARVAAGKTVTTAASATVAILAEGVLKIMLLNRLKMMMVVVGTLGAMGLGMGLAAYSGFANQSRSEAINAQAQESGTQKTGKKNQEKDASTSDTHQLQGTWVIVAQEFRGKPVAKEDLRPQWWHFEGDKVTIYGIDLRISKPEKNEYSYTLAGEKNPKIIELTNGRRLEGGPHKKSPDDLKGIYKIAGDALRIAIGKTELPTKFETKEGDSVIVIVLKREGAAKEKR